MHRIGIPHFVMQSVFGCRRSQPFFAAQGQCRESGLSRASGSGEEDKQHGSYKYPMPLCSQRRGPFVLRIMFLATTVLVGQRADAVDQVSLDNLQASMRALNFLESLPAAGAIVVGVVYAPEIPGSQAAAMEIARNLSAMRGPNSRTVQTIVISPRDLDVFQGRLNVIFLSVGVSMHPERILGAMSRLHLVSISDDPACIDNRSCVLMVRTGQQVEISLNTSLADAVGARFSLVFMMMVKRR